MNADSLDAPPSSPTSVDGARDDGARDDTLPSLNVDSFDAPPSSEPSSPIAIIASRRSHPHRSPAALVGVTLSGRFRVLSAIGSGGMGSVYEALDEQTNTLVAIKALRKSSKPENLSRFRREAETAAAMRHPNICLVHHLGTANGAPFIVMERLEGETLRRRIARMGPFSVADTVAVALQLLDALASAHAMRVLHRDVKPGNVFITTRPGQSPLIKLIDFGLARLLPSSSGDATLITQIGMIPGTPAYLSPEQVNGHRDLDEGVDIWAAGLTLFEMLTAKHGFAADSFDALIRRITLTPAPSTLDFRRDVPPELDAVLARALAKRRDERWKSAAAFRAAVITAWARHRMNGLERGTRLTAGVVRGGDPASDRRGRKKRT